MGDIYKQIEEFEKDYDKIAAKNVWEPCDITKMKDLQKLMYYLEVREAMKNGGEYPGSEYMDQNSYEGAQRRNMNTGRFMSSRGGSGTYPMGYGPMFYNDGRGSGRRYYDGDRGSGRRYYDDDYGSGRRYYDGEKEDAIHKLHKAMDAETNPEFKTAIQEAIRMLEEK